MMRHPKVEPVDPLRVLQHIHGHLGWLAAAALVHPAIALRVPRAREDRPLRRAHWAVGLPTLLVTIVFGLGAGLYPQYTKRIKQTIFLDSPAVGYLFERKEHLAFGALAFAWAGAVAYLMAQRAGGPRGVRLSRLAARVYAMAAAAAIVAAGLATWVAAFRGL